MRTAAPHFGILLVGLTTASAMAQEPLSIEDYRLENGLRVILSEDHSAPVVTVNVWYNVGSANERPGRSGFAHLFEHMMFQGSANVGKAEHMQLVERAGGTLNGSTNSDRTNYYQTLPANRLNLGLWLEADRMRSLAVTDENFANQRNAVQEERRLRIDNQPYANALLEGMTLLYDSTDCFAYAHTVIGSMDDLNAAEVSDVQSFFDLYYAPGNATLTVVGDFEPDAAKSLIQEYFGGIRAGETPPPIQCSWNIGDEPARLVWEDKLANLPAVITVYRTPGHANRDARAIQLLNIILGSGESSRLNRRLVREEQSALQAGTQLLSQRMGTPLLTLAISNQGITPDLLETQLADEVARIRDGGVTEAELLKAKNAFRSGNIFGLQTSMSIAERIQHFVHFHEALGEISTDLDEYMSVTVDDIRRVARMYLTPENSLTVVVVPAGQAETPVP